MNAFFDILREFLPLWLALIVIGFVYLIYLYTKISRKINDLAEKRVQIHKERWESAMEQVQFYKERYELAEKQTNKT